MLNLDMLSENGGHVDKCSACTAEIFKTLVLRSSLLRATITLFLSLTMIHFHTIHYI